MLQATLSMHMCNTLMVEMTVTTRQLAPKRQACDPVSSKNRTSTRNCTEHTSYRDRHRITDKSNASSMGNLYQKLYLYRMCKRDMFLCTIRNESAIQHEMEGRMLPVYTVPPESIYPLARGKTSSLPKGSAANSPQWDEFLNLVLNGRNRTPRQARCGTPRQRNNRS